MSTNPAPAFAYPGAGTFTVTLTVTDTAGQGGSATRTVTISAPTDRAPPVVSLDGPAEALPGSDVSFVATATDNIGVVNVRFEISGIDGLVASDDASSPYSRAFTLPAVVTPGQQLTITAIASDAAGNTARASAPLTITTQHDTIEPTVALLAPGQVAPGTSLLLLARAG